ncbi:unnamed protein product [Amoebophrya sp. A120]|nr:unnamed protein product [Amoebophrya sp. A120]|eukprot:GSA120T00022134001.1
MSRNKADDIPESAYFVPEGVDAIYIIRRMANFPACHEKIMVPMNFRENKYNYTGAHFRKDIQRAVMEYDKLDYLPSPCVRMWHRPHTEAKDAYSVLYSSLGRMNLVTSDFETGPESSGKAKAQKSSIETAIWAIDGTTTVDAVVNGALRLSIQRQQDEDKDAQQQNDPSYISASEKQRNPNKFLEIPTGILSDNVFHDRNREIQDHWNMRDIFNDFENFEDTKTMVLIEIETHGKSLRVDQSFEQMLENNTHSFTVEDWEIAIYMVPQNKVHKVLDGYWETQDELLSPGELHRKKVKEEQMAKAMAMQEAAEKEAQRQARILKGLPPLPEKKEGETSEEEETPGGTGPNGTPSGQGSSSKRKKPNEKKEFKRGLREIGHLKYPTHLSKCYDTPLLRVLDKLDRTIAQTQNPYVTDGKVIKKSRSLKNCCLALINFHKKFTNVNALSETDGLSALHKITLKFLLRGRDDPEDSMSEIFTALMRHPYLNLETRDMDGGKTVLEYALDVYWGQLKANTEQTGKSASGFPEEIVNMKDMPRNNIIGPERRYLRHSVLYELFEPFWQRDSKMRPQKIKPYLKCFRNARNALAFAKRRETFSIDEEMDFRAREARLLKNPKFLDALNVTCSWDPLDLHNARQRDRELRFDGLEMIDFIKNPVFRRIRNKQILIRSFHSLLSRSLVVDIQKSWAILFNDLQNETNVDVHALMEYPDVSDGNNCLLHKILRVGTVYDVSIALTGELCIAKASY